jgi:hypothetical protein
MDKDYRDTRPRPSTLPLLDQCPRFVSRKKSEVNRDALDEAAEEGTILHAKMEKLALIPVDLWDESIEKDPDLSPDQVTILKEASVQVADLFRLGLPVVTLASLPSALTEGGHYQLEDALMLPADTGIFVEVSVSPKVCRPGTADLFARYGNKGVLCDYKFTRVIREHDLQMKAYVVGVFNAVPVDYVEVRIVAPRLRDAHPAVTYNRKTHLPLLQEELSHVIDRSADLFAPGCPGETCAFCEGNARCPYQMASLKDIPMTETSLVMPDAWLPILLAETLPARGQRRQLVKWLGAFIDAAKEDDKAWAIANPGLELPGFTKSVQLGRASLDRDKLKEANEALLLRFGITENMLLGYTVPDKDRLAEFVGLLQGLGADEAKTAINQALAPFTKRSEDIIAFRASRKTKGALNA